MQLHLIVIGLVWCKTSEASPGVFGDFTNMAMGSFNKYVFARVTSEGLKELFKPIVDDVMAKMGTLSCVQGVYLDVDNAKTTLLMFKGNMTYPSEVTLQVSVPLEDSPDTVNCKVMITIPEIMLNFTFHYSDLRVIIRMNREGYIVLRQDGPIVLKFLMELPKSQTTVDQMLSEGKCAAIMKTFESNLYDKSLRVMKVYYESIARAVGITISEDHIKRLVAGLEEDLQDNIEMALQAMVEPVFMAFHANCIDSKYRSLSARESRQALDCEYFRPASRYTPLD